MSSPKFKSDSFCVGGRHRSAPKKFMEKKIGKVKKY